MNISIVKKPVKLLATSFPNLANSIWKKVYPSLIYKSEWEDAETSAQPDTDGVAARSRPEVFRHIFKKNGWENAESVSGYGSTLYNTTILRKTLPKLLEAYDVSSLLDAPCGDFNWMRYVEMPGVAYTGCDIVPELVAELSQKYSAPNRSFRVLDICNDPIPPADLWLCRDALIHLTLADGLKVLENAARSNVKYLLSTTYPIVKANRDIPTGAFRYIDLMKPPYNLPAPLQTIDDFLAPNAPRQLALWSAEQLCQRFRR